MVIEYVVVDLIAHPHFGSRPMCLDRLNVTEGSLVRLTATPTPLLLACTDTPVTHTFAARLEARRTETAGTCGHRGQSRVEDRDAESCTHSLEAGSGGKAACEGDHGRDKELEANREGQGSDGKETILPQEEGEEPRPSGASVRDVAIWTWRRSARGQTYRKAAEENCF